MQDGVNAGVFPEAKADSLDRLGSGYIKEFSDYIERVGIKSDKSLVFHSLRHTFVDELRRRGYADTVIAVFVGHERGSVTAGYGKLPQFSPAQRLEIKIGRASCRERVGQYVSISVVAVSLK